MKFLPHIKWRLTRTCGTVYRMAILLIGRARQVGIERFRVLPRLIDSIWRVAADLARVVFGLLAITLLILLFWRMFARAEAIWIDDLLGTSNLEVAATVKWETIKVLAQVLFGPVLIVGIYIVYRKARASEKTAKAQHDAYEQKVFNEATAKLGDESASVRLGWIYALDTLARSNEAYLVSVVEILCAHLRKITQKEDYQEKYKDKPSNEIQSLAKVLRALNTKLSVLNSRKEENGNSNFLYLDLSASYLVGVNLTNACLKDVNLTETNLQRASLDGAQMQKALLSRAQMQGAFLHKAQMQWAHLEGAQMQGTRLWGAQLQGAHLRWAQMQGAELRETQLQEADLHQTEMQGATLDRTQMQGVKLWEVQLQGAKLNEVDLRGAYTSSFIVRLNLNLPARVKERQNEQTDLTTVIFSGGLKQEDARRIREQLAECQKNEWMTKEEVAKINKILEEHQGKPIIKQLPSGIKTDSYDEKAVYAIIAEHMAATRGVKKIVPKTNLKNTIRSAEASSSLISFFKKKAQQR